MIKKPTQKERSCPKCKGTGEVKSIGTGTAVTCPTCNGKGTIKYWTK